LPHCVQLDSVTANGYLERTGSSHPLLRRGSHGAGAPACHT